MSPRYRVTLTEQERNELDALTKRGKISARKFIHARALLLCDAGAGFAAICTPSRAHDSRLHGSEDKSDISGFHTPSGRLHFVDQVGVAIQHFEQLDQRQRRFGFAVFIA